MLNALKQHWPEYLMEAAELGIFMVSACAFGALLEYPGSPVHQALPDPSLRRVLMGAAMGLTAISIIYSPFGKRSGAHFNPSVTLTFWRLGKVAGADAFFYAIAQFIGAVIGVALPAVILRSALTHPSVNYVATLPGTRGVVVAFIAEVTITFILMTMVLNVSNRMNVARYTGLFAGAMVAIFISIEAPFSGMSMNPARTFGSAFVAQVWDALWIYFTAPPLGMLLAAEVYLRLKGARGVLCAKLHHHNHKRCIFKCGFGECAADVRTSNVEAVMTTP
ncbi:MAG: Aquaporin Z [Acidobacteria bacterium]|nr:Aquaporin Z [Acidobacteriota bacterium]